MGQRLRGEETYEIVSRGLSVRFCPDMGGRLLAFRGQNGQDIFVRAEPHSFDVTNWPRAGAYPLVPYHNRLANARVAAEGEIFHLRSHPAAAPNTLHGPGHTRPWVAGLHEENRFNMSLDYIADGDWPWDFHAEQRFELSDESLRLTMTVENRSGRPMPAGMGWHPYFASRDPIVSDACYVWPHGPDYIPDGERNRLTGGEQIVHADTAYFQGWSKARISLNNDVTATLTASSSFGFLVVHRGDPTHICVEPVTHVANAWNLSLPPLRTGAALLPPGARLTGHIEIRLSGLFEGH